MKKIVALCFVLCAFVITNTIAQQRNCASHTHLMDEIAADPGRAGRLQQIEEFTNAYIASNPSNDRTVVTIPVVFHIVYNTTAQNISDAQCIAQINQLNLDYARLNSDAGNTPSAFASIAANTQIQFCLAQRTPTGGATTGIIRKSTTTTSFSTNDNVKRSANGGDDAWDRNSYLNIWSCNLSGGVLGYAQFPGGTASTDGVVLLYSAIGSVASPGTAAPYNLGRTATHEVGHWLNLYHIWGDDGTGCTGSDNVSDTPNQADENYGCPVFPTVSCSNGPNGDMYMNYMDYTDDNCMNMFSTGQSTRMNALFAVGGSRISLASSLGCQPPSIGSCGTPGSLSATSITTTSATLSWSAVSGATSYNLQYKTSSSSTFTTVNTASTSYGLSGLTSATSYNYKVQAVCSTSGSYSSLASFTTASPSGGCTNNYESNGTTSTATSIAVNTNITSMIATNGDIDWFKFNNTTTQRRIKVTLTTLPGDYDVRLYRGTTTSVGLSENGGTASEQIILNTTNVNTYYIKVYGYVGAFSSTSCYTLNASISANNFREIGNGNSTVEVVESNMGLYPNPTNGKLNVDYIAASNANLSIAIIDMLGRSVYVSNQEVFEGPNTFGIATDDLANGIYMIQVVNGSEKQIERFVVQH
jgi:hypothetical protein